MDELLRPQTNDPETTADAAETASYRRLAMQAADDESEAPAESRRERRAREKAEREAAKIAAE